MPIIAVTRCAETNNNPIPNAVVIAFSQNDLMAQVSHTPEGQDLPPLTFAKCNRTNSLGQCLIAVPSSNHRAVVACVKEGGLASIHCHVDVSS